MNKLSTLALALTVAAVTASAAPAFAATSNVGNVPFCTSNPGADHNLRDQLNTELLVKNQTVLAIDNWNGCLKAITVDFSGKTTVAFYDETLSVIARQG